MSTTTQFFNRERVLRRMSEMPPRVRRRVSQAIDISADEVVALMKTFVPVRGGRRGGGLKRSIRAVKGSVNISMGEGRRSRGSGLRGSGGRGDADLTAFVLAGDEDAFYAHMVEFGTGPHINGGIFAGTQHPGTDPHPFFLPAWRSRRRPTRARISRAMRKGIQEAFR